MNIYVNKKKEEKEREQSQFMK